MHAQPASPIREVLLLHHTHTDIGYTHPQPVLWELQRRFIDQAIDLCDRTADWPEPSRMRWTCEVTATLMHWLRHASSKQIDRFRALVAHGQISAGAMFTNITPLSDADQLARQLAPLSELRRSLGLSMTVAINHDVNGLPWPLTQLLLDAGVKMVLMGINPHFGGFPEPRPGLFQWRGSDGRDLLVWNGSHYSLFGCVLVGRPGLNTVHSTDLMDQALQRHFQHLATMGYPYDFAYLTGTHVYHCDNNPPYYRQAEMVRRWNDEERPVTVRFATPETLYARLLPLINDQTPIHQGDWTDYWNFGSASAALETKANRHTVRRLHGAELLRAHQGNARPDTAHRSEQAWWHANLYDEHTWGTAYPLRVSPETSAEQWCHKSHYAYQARSLTTLLMRDELERLAGNPDDEAEGSQGLLFYNPAPIARKAIVRVPRRLIDGSWQHFSSLVQRLDILQEQSPDDDTQHAWVGPIDLPASGYRKLPLAALPDAGAPSELALGDDFIESPFHKLTFDPKTGRILSLWDKKRSWQAIDAASDWSFFGMVRETLNMAALSPEETAHLGRQAFFKSTPDPLAPDKPNWNANWPALREGTRSLRNLRVEHHRGRISLILSWDAPGMADLTQTISLFAHRQAIELTASFHKADVSEPEGIYFAFPLTLAADWQAHFDTADLPVRYDDEQVPGCCRDWLTLGRWVTLADPQYGATLASPDAPLVQLGGFNFGQTRQARPADMPPLLLSWVMNNYWSTNFRISQPGRVNFRYELTTHGPYDAVASTRMGLEAAWAVEAHPIVGATAGHAGSLLECQGDQGVFPLAVSAANDGQGVIVQMVNVASHPARVALRWMDKPIVEAWRCDTLQENQQPLPVQDGQVVTTLEARRVRLVRLRF